MVKITKTEKSVKGQDMKYYLATKQSFLIVPPEKTAHAVINSFKRFSKFAAIGMAGFVSWIALKPDGSDYQTEPIHESGRDAFTSVERTAGEVDKRSSASENPEVRLEDQDANIWPTPEPEPAPSHSGVQEFSSQIDSDISNTGSVSLDRTVYPQPFDGTGAESIEPFIFSIIIPIIVIVGGIIIERVLTSWFCKRKRK